MFLGSQDLRLIAWIADHQRPRRVQPRLKSFNLNLSNQTVPKINQSFATGGRCRRQGAETNRIDRSIRRENTLFYRINSCDFLEIAKKNLI